MEFDHDSVEDSEDADSDPPVETRAKALSEIIKTMDAVKANLLVDPWGVSDTAKLAAEASSSAKYSLPEVAPLII